MKNKLPWYYYKIKRYKATRKQIRLTELVGGIKFMGGNRFKGEDDKSFRRRSALYRLGTNAIRGGTTLYAYEKAKEAVDKLSNLFNNTRSSRFFNIMYVPTLNNPHTLDKLTMRRLEKYKIGSDTEDRWKAFSDKLNAERLRNPLAIINLAQSINDWDFYKEVYDDFSANDDDDLALSMVISWLENQLEESKNYVNHIKDLL